MGENIENEVLQTYRGVYLDIENSKECVLKNGLYFYFCSIKMKEKFETNVDNYIKIKIDKIKKIMPNTQIMGLEVLFAIEYYKYVEKRGYRIETMHGARIKQGYLTSDIEFMEE